MFDIEIYDYFAKIVYDKTGIFYPAKDYYRLDARINNLINHYNCKNAKDLMNLFQTNYTVEMESYLIDICTNNETYFFRDNRPFDSLVELCDKIWTNRPYEKIKIWSCASSTGQEPLSIVMSLIEKFPSLTPARLEVLATDISKSALEKCNLANYTSLEVQRGLPIGLLMKYFDNQQDNSWTAKSYLKDFITYKSFNLLTDIFPRNEFHIIFCRNVLIYQEKINKEKIMNNLYESMVSDGHLVMGAGESLIGSDVDLVQETIGSSMFFKKVRSSSKVA